MKPAYFQKDTSGRDRWMVSYLDVLTILLILFVAIAAQALQTPPPKPPEHVVNTAATPVSAMVAIQKELEQSNLDVTRDPRGVVISLPQALLFAPGEDHISADALETVGVIGDVLRKIPNDVSLVGHSDAIPIHNRRFSSNWELASARGLRLLELLSSRYGIDESRLSVQSYGSFAPKSTDDTPDGRASNRRVEIVILEKP